MNLYIKYQVAEGLMKENVNLNKNLYLESVDESEFCGHEYFSRYLSRLEAVAKKCGIAQKANVRPNFRHSLDP